LGGFTPLLKPRICGLIKGWREALASPPQTFTNIKQPND